jgi:hypothetical protein
MRKSLVLTLVALCGCGGTPAAQPDAGLDAGLVDAGFDGEDASVVVRLRGGLQKGPFVLGSSLGISPVDSVGNPTGALFNTTTLNDLGEFVVEFSYLGAVALEANGFYYNEATGLLSSGPLTLRAYHEVTSGGAQAAYVNLITHLTYSRVRQLLVEGSTVSAATAQAEGELRAELGIGPSDFTLSTPGSQLDLFGGDGDANAYLLAVSAVLAQIGYVRGGTAPDATLQELLNTISADLAMDGELDAALKAELAAVYRTMNGDAVMSLFRARLALLGSDAVVPNIHRILDNDADDLVNARDNCRDASNPAQENRDADVWGDACDNDTLWATPIWSATELEWTSSQDAGDVDGDGDIDIVVGGGVFPTALYRNEGGTFTARAAWTPTGWAGIVAAVALGDLDDDGDLDLVAAGDQIRLYRNDSGMFTASAVWMTTESGGLGDVALGDVDGDGDLDIAAAQPGVGYLLFHNDRGAFPAAATWRATAVNSGSGSVAWGDADGDGDLDLAAGNLQSELYRNEEGVLTTTPVWRSAESDSGHAVVWGDMDGDGDLDLATGTHIYRNDGGELLATSVWQSPLADIPGAGGILALGDVDDDGDLDLATVSFAGAVLYRNDGGTLTNLPVWEAPDIYSIAALLFIDADGDGDQDLATAGEQSVFVNTLR